MSKPRTPEQKALNAQRSREWRARYPERSVAGVIAWRAKQHPDRLKRYGDKSREDARMQVIMAYGGKCTCCPEGTPIIYRFLTIDHINGTGVKQSERRKNGHTATGLKLYAWLRRNNYPPGFRVLCFNCNWAEGHGGCPHNELMRLVG